MTSVRSDATIGLGAFLLFLGVVREARNGGRYLIEIKGRAITVDGG